MKNWIQKNCVFTSHGGRDLYRKPASLMRWQANLLDGCFEPNGKIKKNKIGLFGARKVGKSFLFSWICCFFLRDKNAIGWSGAISASVYEQGLKLMDFVSEQIRLSAEKKTSGLRRDWL